MPLKTSKPRKKLPSQKKAEQTFAEAELAFLAAQFTLKLLPEDRIFLEGEMGAGKSTFARYVLEALGVTRLFEGSPTFSIAHEYQTRMGTAIHIDFYRLKSMGEIEQAGIPEYFWSRPCLILSEWISNWSEFESEVIKTQKKNSRVWRVSLTIDDQDTSRRRLEIKKLF